MLLLSLFYSVLFFVMAAASPWRLAVGFPYSPLLRALTEEEKASLPIWEGGYNVKPWLRDHPELLGGR